MLSLSLSIYLSISPSLSLSLPLSLYLSLSLSHSLSPSLSLSFYFSHPPSLPLSLSLSHSLSLSPSLGRFIICSPWQRRPDFLSIRFPISPLDPSATSHHGARVCVCRRCRAPCDCALGHRSYYYGALVASAACVSTLARGIIMDTTEI